MEGIKEITDPLISIYNPQGIKAAALVDNKTDLTYELAIPLKLLGLSLKDLKPVVYNIKLTGMNADMTQISTVAAALRAQRTERRNTDYVLGARSGAVLEGPDSPRLITLFSPTDFTGEYTLAK